MKTIRVCCGTGCLANGSAKVAAEFERLTRGTDVQVECHVKRTGCNGFCENGPLVTILPDDRPDPVTVDLRTNSAKIIDRNGSSLTLNSLKAEDLVEVHGSFKGNDFVATLVIKY